MSNSVADQMGPISDEPDIPPTPPDARRSSIEGGPLATIRYDTAPWGAETDRRVGEPIDVPRGCGWCKRPASIWRYSATGDAWPSCGDHGLTELAPAVELDADPVTDLPVRAVEAAEMALMDVRDDDGSAPTYWQMADAALRAALPHLPWPVREHPERTQQ